MTDIATQLTLSQAIGLIENFYDQSDDLLLQALAYLISKEAE